MITASPDDILLFTETTIDGSHFLAGYDGKCRNLHGHTWKVQLWILGKDVDCDSVGILFDFGKVKEIQELFDHKVINDIDPFTTTNPTAENLTNFIYRKLKEDYPHLQFCVRLYETCVMKNTWAQRGDFFV